MLCVPLRPRTGPFRICTIAGLPKVVKPHSSCPPLVEPRARDDRCICHPAPRPQAEQASFSMDSDHGPLSDPMMGKRAPGARGGLYVIRVRHRS